MAALGAELRQRKGIRMSYYAKLLAAYRAASGECVHKQTICRQLAAMLIAGAPVKGAA